MERRAAEAEDNAQFFRDQSERMLEMAVLPVRLATGTVTARDLQRFVGGIATSPRSGLKSQEWKAAFHSQTLAAAFNAKKTPIEQAELQALHGLLARRDADA